MFGVPSSLMASFCFPCRLCVLHASSSPRAARLSVWPSGPWAWGGCPQDGEAGPQGGPLVPTHRGGMLLIGHSTTDQPSIKRWGAYKEEEEEGEQGEVTNGVIGGRGEGGGVKKEEEGRGYGCNILHLTQRFWIWAWRHPVEVLISCLEHLFGLCSGRGPSGPLGASGCSVEPHSVSHVHTQP